MNKEFYPVPPQKNHIIMVEAYDDMGHFMINPYNERLLELVFKDINREIMMHNGCALPIHRKGSGGDRKLYHVNGVSYLVNFNL